MSEQMIEALKSSSRSAAATVPSALDVEHHEDEDDQFVWPMPPFASYSAPQQPDGLEPCELEGHNGGTRAGTLIGFQPHERLLHMVVPPSRGALPLRFERIRRLTLTTPMPPVLSAAADPHAGLLDHMPLVSFRLTLAAGGVVEGHTVGHVENDVGLFLFPPANDTGSVYRSFVPREAYKRIDFGDRIGEVLARSAAVSPRHLELAAQEQKALRARKLGDILVTRQIVTPEQLLDAIEHQARMPMVRLGEALIGLGLINEEQLNAALTEQKTDRSIPLGELLVRAGSVSRQDLQTAMARKMGYPVVDPQQFPAEVEALGRLPWSVAERLNVLPLLLRGHRLVVAMDDPSNRSIIEEVEFASQCKVVPVLALSSHIAKALGATYERFGIEMSGSRDGGGGSANADGLDASRLVESLEQQHSQAERSDDDSQIEQSDNSLVRLINTMIVDAHSQRVSDIHVETHPGREKVRIRFRRDGTLKPYLELPHTYRAALVARIKIMCDLDISERRKPQDGKINFAKFSPQHRLELRVATIPTANGLEDVVMRLLASTKPMALNELGLAEGVYKRLRVAIERPYGMVLCVGPTGSGKTTTLHSALGAINTAERKIWTAEDPVEITQKGLRQVQINPKIDWTFAKALRAFLRADPDVIMVGEIRDRETAQMAVEASLTGHLVMSTLHTNSAPETVTRLLDMGMDPFNFADSLLAVLAQRLVRRLCSNCRTARDATADEIEELVGDYRHALPEDLRPTREALIADWAQRHGQGGRLQHYTSPGCKHCDETGLRGRAGLHELLTVDRDLRHLIQTGARVEELQQTAMRSGMRTLRQDGIEKVLAGVSTIEEVRSTSNM